MSARITLLGVRGSSTPKQNQKARNDCEQGKHSVFVRETESKVFKSGKDEPDTEQESSRATSDAHLCLYRDWLFFFLS